MIPHLFNDVAVYVRQGRADGSCRYERDQKRRKQSHRCCPIEARDVFLDGLVEGHAADPGAERLEVGFDVTPAGFTR